MTDRNNFNLESEITQISEDERSAAFAIGSFRLGMMGFDVTPSTLQPNEWTARLHSLCVPNYDATTGRCYGLPAKFCEANYHSNRLSPEVTHTILRMAAQRTVRIRYDDPTRGVREILALPLDLFKDGVSVPPAASDHAYWSIAVSNVTSDEECFNEKLLLSRILEWNDRRPA